MSKMSKENEAYWRGWHNGYRCAIEDVHVVRCKDCKNLRLVEGARGRWFGCSAIEGVDGSEFEVEGDFFCAWGEREEDD